MQVRAQATDAEARPEAAPDEIRRTESHFDGAGGRSLFCCSWQPPKPDRAVVLVHGFGEHILRYDELGVWLSGRGSVVHGFDLRGHGRSAGRRGHVDRFDEYLDDLEIFVARVRERAAGLPLHLVGHSMGGLVASAFVREREPELTSVATSAAALAMAPDLSPLKRTLARLLRPLAPRVSMDAGVDPMALSTDPEVGKRYEDDPHVHGRSTFAHAVEAFDAIERTGAGGAAVRLPMFLMHGADDSLCLPSGSESFYASLPGAFGDADAPPAALRVYPGLRHEIFNEPDRARVYEDLLDWMLRIERGETNVE